MSELLQNTATLEMQLRQQADIRQNAEEQLLAANDMCDQLEKQKQYLNRNLDEESDLKARVRCYNDIFWGKED